MDKQQDKIKNYLKNHVFTSIYHNFIYNKQTKIDKKFVLNEIKEYFSAKNKKENIYLKNDTNVIKHYIYNIEYGDYKITNFNINRLKYYPIDDLINFLVNYHNSFIQEDFIIVYGIYVPNLAKNNEKYNNELILYILAKIIINENYIKHREYNSKSEKIHKILKNSNYIPSPIAMNLSKSPPIFSPKASPKASPKRIKLSKPPPKTSPPKTSPPKTSPPKTSPPKTSPKNIIPTPYRNDKGELQLNAFKPSALFNKQKKNRGLYSRFLNNLFR